MDQTTDLNTWKASLNLLESENSAPIDYAAIIEKLAKIFIHMCPQTAPRLQKELELCTSRSHDALAHLFDKIDLSDKKLLCSFLRSLQAFGYFRLAQITYHIDQTIREDSNPIYSPPVEKAKWTDMEPLLPSAGTIGWKGIMNHCLVREEPELSQTCLQLLCQKLHFYSIVTHLDRYSICQKQIKRNGEKVAEKLFELIRDVAHEDERMIGLDEYMFRLLKPLTSGEQQATIIDAVVQDLFKPYLTQKTIEENEISELYNLIKSSIMNESPTQNVFISKLLDHLKCNMVRLKRRHSTDVLPENGHITWKTLIDSINEGDKLQSVLSKAGQIQLSTKSIQTNYITFWLQVVNQILPQKTLTATNSLKIMGVCSFLVLKTIPTANVDLINELSLTLARTIEFTTQIRLDKLFGSCNPTFLVELTKTIYNLLESNSIIDALLAEFYKSYLHRYLKCCTLRVAKVEPEDLMDLVNVICDKNICGSSAYKLQSIFIQEVSECLNDHKNRISNKTHDVYLRCSRICAKRLYKFIKRNSCFKTGSRPDSRDIAETSDTGDHNASLVDDDKRAIAMSSLISILSIAIGSKDHEILDCYGNLLLKLYKVVESSFAEAVNSVQCGKDSSTNLIDPYIAKLVLLYVENKELVSPYIQRELENNLTRILLRNEVSQIKTIGHGSCTKSTRKAIYSQLKAKLESLENQHSSSSVDVYQAIINKQYGSAVDQSSGAHIDTIQEEFPCFRRYQTRLHSVQEIFFIIAEHSNLDLRTSIMNELVTWLEQCDHLDHPRFLYILSLIQSLIPKNIQLKSATSDSFRDVIPRISCALIGLCKSVELGPSIHAYKNSGAHKSNRGIQCCTYANCIRIYTSIFQNYPPRIVNPYMTEAMQVCVSANLFQYAKYTTRLHVFFIELASSIANLMMSICIGRKEDEVVRCSMPVFLTVFSHLLRCVIIASDRQKIETLPKSILNGYGDSNNIGSQEKRESLRVSVRDNYERNLKLLAIDIGKCLTNMCKLRVKLVDHAPHLISAYIKDIQRASCPDHIKLHLNEGIFRVFNLVDAHQKDRQGQITEEGIQRITTAGRAGGSLFEMIHARLDQASREIFRDMHENHNKFHRYLGKC